MKTCCRYIFFSLYNNNKCAMNLMRGAFVSYQSRVEDED